MGWYANLKIGKKLACGFSVIIVLSILIGIIGVQGMRSMDDTLDEMYNNSMQSVFLANQLYVDVLYHYRRVYRYALTPSQEVKDTVASQTRINEKSIAEVLDKYHKMELNAREMELVGQFEKIWPEYLVVKERVFRLSRGHRAPEADAVLEKDGREIFKKLDDTLAELIRMEMAHAKEERGWASNLFHSRIGWFIVMVLFAVTAGFIMASYITRSIVRPITAILDALLVMSGSSMEKSRLAEGIASGDLSRDLPDTPPIQVDRSTIQRDETGDLTRAVCNLEESQLSLDGAFRRMTDSLRHNRQVEQDLDWLKTGQNELNALLRGEQAMAEMAEKVLAFLARYLDCGVGTFYFHDTRENMLRIVATYAFTRRKNLNDRLGLGEGIAGQAARERKMICLANVPDDYLAIASSLGEAVPRNVAVLPLVHDNTLMGVVELGAFHAFAEKELRLLDSVMEGLAVGISVNISRQRVNELLEQTQQQTEELRVQQEELQQSNEELEERAQMLEQQREQIRNKNREVEEASKELQRKAEELERISAYKSEFLANMSHELRTPLNSLMILSHLLMDNKEGNLTEKQVGFACTINDAGNDLLNLINDILDLSKVEAGRLEFHFEELTVPDLLEPLETMFRPLAEQRRLNFRITGAPDVPGKIVTDVQRTQQILKNLLSNAFKFTEQGGVELTIAIAPPAENPLTMPALAIAVRDSGIGIPLDKQEPVFNAFQQGDGSTSRKFGGTGLGLSISRQLARAMQGEITLASREGEGSVFTVYLPLTPPAGMPANKAEADRVVPESAHLQGAERQPPRHLTVPAPSTLADDREKLQKGQRSILIIEDDMNFARILMEMVRERGFAALAAANGEEGLYLADHYLPNAIILDVMLPHVDGWGVMQLLKENPRTRHIPVHFLTCLEDRQKAMAMGAIGFVTKPVNPTQLTELFATIENAISRSLRKLLIVEDDPSESQGLVALLEGRDVVISVAGSGKEAMTQLSRETFDCMVLDLSLSDMSGFDLLEHIEKQDEKRRLPVIIHSGRSLSHEEEIKLRHYTESIIIKGAKSPERLLNEVTLFLHQVESSLNPDKQRMLRASLDKETMLEGKKVLLVDDDMRNIFSLTSILAEKHMIVVEAENGREALVRLQEHPDVDLVLMDIMMPEMDGYETIRTIRRDPRFARLSVIAMTAKALKGDQEKCLEAGASDYIAKPIDVEKLLSLMRVWLYQKG
ncbi:response regulator [Geotalea sp. SG265]|uniref:response regulator n=1 Tax=Geotalea sp. SG265 TaxID=2922867 RepID=UPI001FAEA857|nr:response regulator [Geotalea sp. SG265]